MLRDISFLIECSKSNVKKINKVRGINCKYNFKLNESLDTKIVTLKQKIQLKAMRIRRFTKRTNFYKQNKTLQENTKKFYRDLGKNQIKVEENPSREEIEEFWSDIWSNPKEFRTNAEWIKERE